MLVIPTACTKSSDLSITMTVRLHIENLTGALISWQEQLVDCSKKSVQSSIAYVADFATNVNSLRLKFLHHFWALLKPASEPPSIPVASFDEHFAKVHHISLAPGEALVCSIVFDSLPAPDRLQTMKTDVQVALHRSKYDKSSGNC